MMMLTVCAMAVTWGAVFAVTLWLLRAKNSAVGDANPAVWRARNRDLVISGQSVIGVRLPSGIVVTWDYPLD